MKYPILFAILTALFWGMYGPALGQARTEAGSPFKPYVAIGLAYLVWGLVGGAGGMAYRGDNIAFSPAALTWGFIAGSLGAWGALTLTLAMFSGGGAMPHIVMPIVFGGAVTVSAIVSAMTAHKEAKISPMLWIGITGIAICIVIVAYNTPHAGPPHKKPTETPHAAVEGPEAGATTPADA